MSDYKCKECIYNKLPSKKDFVSSKDSDICVECMAGMGSERLMFKAKEGEDE